MSISCGATLWCGTAGVGRIGEASYPPRSGRRFVNRSKASVRFTPEISRAAAAACGFPEHWAGSTLARRATGAGRGSFHRASSCVRRAASSAYGGTSTPYGSARRRHGRPRGGHQQASDPPHLPPRVCHAAPALQLRHQDRAETRGAPRCLDHDDLSARSQNRHRRPQPPRPNLPSCSGPTTTSTSLFSLV